MQLPDRSDARQSEGATMQADAALHSAAVPQATHPDARRSERVTLEVYFGTHIRKRFTEGYFRGVVTSYCPQYEWYEITYEDGDREEIGEEEVKRIRLPSVHRRGFLDAQTSAGSMHFSESFLKEHLNVTKRKDTWVCCSKCEKWRMIPPWVDPGPIKRLKIWFCSMNEQDQYHNHCEAEEREQKWYLEYFHKIRKKRKQLRGMHVPPSPALEGSGTAVGTPVGGADAAAIGFRCKRKRTPRTRYDPQQCPATDWLSDGPSLQRWSTTKPLDVVATAGAESPVGTRRQAAESHPATVQRGPPCQLSSPAKSSACPISAKRPVGRPRKHPRPHESFKDPNGRCCTSPVKGPAANACPAFVKRPVGRPRNHQVEGSVGDPPLGRFAGSNGPFHQILEEEPVTDPGPVFIQRPLCTSPVRSPAAGSCRNPRGQFCTPPVKNPAGDGCPTAAKRPIGPSQTKQVEGSVRDPSLESEEGAKGHFHRGPEEDFVTDPGPAAVTRPLGTSPAHSSAADFRPTPVERPVGRPPTHQLQGSSPVGCVQKSHGGGSVQDPPLAFYEGPTRPCRAVLIAGPVAHPLPASVQRPVGGPQKMHTQSYAADPLPSKMLPLVSGASEGERNILHI